MQPQPYPTRRLPQRPNLEQLRQQAKDLLDLYRAGDAAAAAEVRTFERSPDPGAFALNDAQRVLARAYGYESWAKLKAFVDGVNIARLAEAAQAGDLEDVRAMIRARPELVHMDRAGNDEHRALHYAVLRRDTAMTRFLMESGADARKGIYPHRDATTAHAIARDRGYDDVLAVIEAEEQRRREATSCPNSTISPLQDEINAAIYGGDSETALRLLKADESMVRACDREGRTPLHVSAEAGSEDLVVWLLSRGASPRKIDVKGYTPLDRAALAADPRNGRVQPFRVIARQLLERGAELTIRGAVALGDLERIRELVSQDPSVLKDIHWMRGGLVSLAVRHVQIEAVRLLLDLGADVDERTMLHELEEPTSSWGGPLWHAALLGQRDIVELLLDRGADPNANVYASGWPLRNAYQHEDDSVKRLLLERGAKPQPYMVAEANDVAEARRLLEADAGEELAQELVWAAANHGNPEIVELAIGRLRWARNDPRWNWIMIQPMRGVDEDGEDHEGFFACMEVLLREGVDANVSSRFGQTPLHFTAARGGMTETERVRFVAMLLDHGGRADLRDELLKSTVLGWACRWGRKGMVQLLIERGAPVEEPDAEEWATPLAWATKMGHREIVEQLKLTL